MAHRPQPGPQGQVASFRKFSEDARSSPSFSSLTSANPLRAVPDKSAAPKKEGPSRKSASPDPFAAISGDFESSSDDSSDSDSGSDAGRSGLETFARSQHSLKPSGVLINLYGAASLRSNEDVVPDSDTEPTRAAANRASKRDVEGATKHLADLKETTAGAPLDAKLDYGNDKSATISAAPKVNGVQTNVIAGTPQYENGTQENSSGSDSESGSNSGSDSDSESESESGNEEEAAKGSRQPTTASTKPAPNSKASVASPALGGEDSEESSEEDSDSSSEEDSNESSEEDVDDETKKPSRSDAAKATNTKALSGPPSQSVVVRSENELAGREVDESDVEMADESIAITDRQDTQIGRDRPSFLAPDFELRHAQGGDDEHEIAEFFSKARLEGKQVWYFTAPASVPISVVEKLEIPLDDGRRGESVFTHNGDGFGVDFSAQSSRNTIQLLIPSKYGDEYKPSRRVDKVMHVKRITSVSAESSRPPGSAGSVHRLPRAQPEGLRPRYEPFGLPDLPPVSSEAPSRSTTPVRSSARSSANQIATPYPDAMVVDADAAAAVAATDSNRGRSAKGNEPAKCLTQSNSNEAMSTQPQTPAEGGAGKKAVAPQPSQKKEKAETPAEHVLRHDLPSATQPARHVEPRTKTIKFDESTRESLLTTPKNQMSNRKRKHSSEDDEAGVAAQLEEEAITAEKRRKTKRGFSPELGSSGRGLSAPATQVPVPTIPGQIAGSAGATATMSAAADKRGKGGMEDTGGRTELPNAVAAMDPEIDAVAAAHDTPTVAKKTRNRRSSGHVKGNAAEDTPTAVKKGRGAESGGRDAKGTSNATGHNAEAATATPTQAAVKPAKQTPVPPPIVPKLTPVPLPAVTPKSSVKQEKKVGKGKRRESRAAEGPSAAKEVSSAAKDTKERKVTHVPPPHIPGKNGAV